MTKYVLGLDVGVAAHGWAIVIEPKSPEVTPELHLGVHRFEAGVHEPGKIGQGREEPSAKPRRDARQARRQTQRRQNRRRQVLKALQYYKLLPTKSDSETIHEYFLRIDRDLAHTWCDGEHRHWQNMPYRLRAAAVEHQIELTELGRALYHLAQRRGFLSNRKTDKPDEQDTAFKNAIRSLADAVSAHNPPYLGSYLASLEPDQQRLRDQRTSRQLYLDEFEAIWLEQSKHHQQLTSDAYEAIQDAIFYQRPLRSQRHLLGHCPLTGQVRAPIALRSCQRFRTLQRLNDLRIIYPDGNERRLEPNERDKIKLRLMRDGDVKYSSLKTKKMLNLPPGTRFNHEEIGEKSLIGHRTDAKLREAIGEPFDQFDDALREQIVEDLRSIRSHDVLVRRLKQAYHLDGEAAEAVANIHLEEGRSNHSRQAVEAMLPEMEDGTHYASARQKVFQKSLEVDEHVFDMLPPIFQWYSEDNKKTALRNPAINRGLTELRKLVNAIIRRYGKPDHIHIEFARDLKKSRLARQRVHKINQDRRKKREQVASILLKEYGIHEPRRDDYLKWLLYEECGGLCPYTTHQIEPSKDLFGPNPSVEIEHIWPYSASLDNSYVNLTLCHHQANKRKAGRTPLQAYSSEELEVITSRIRRFQTDRFTLREKLRRFTEPIPDDFSSRHLNDTRHLACEAADYLATLYGGRNGTDRHRRIHVVTGGLTATLRRAWGLNRLLGDFSDEKCRSDHRHHAIDALVVALSTERHVQSLAEASKRAENQHIRRLFSNVSPPWPTILEDVRTALARLNVSYRQNRKLRGKLHKETNYSRQIHGQRRIRRELHNGLKASEIDKIVDSRIRRVIQAKLKELNETDPGKAFSDAANLPMVPGPNGQPQRIRHVRIHTNDKPVAIGSGKYARHVVLGNNHHTVIYTGQKDRWFDQECPLLLAYQRRSNHEPVVQVPAGKNLVFSLVINEHLLIDDEINGKRLMRVANISKGDIELIEHTDGRTQKERKCDRERFSATKLQKHKAKKVHVTYLGEVTDAGG